MNRRFGGTYHLQLQGKTVKRARDQRPSTAPLFFDPENGGDTFLLNVGSCTDHTASFPRIRKPVSVSRIYIAVPQNKICCETGQFVRICLSLRQAIQKVSTGRVLRRFFLFSTAFAQND
jgi:hypothetical protein